MFEFFCFFFFNIEFLNGYLINESRAFEIILIIYSCCGCQTIMQVIQPARWQPKTLGVSKTGACLSAALPVEPWTVLVIINVGKRSASHAINGKNREEMSSEKCNVAIRIVVRDSASFSAAHSFSNRIKQIENDCYKWRYMLKNQK